jgi:threonine dehydrogenase-like Zn-dependent dehydrogenase
VATTIDSEEVQVEPSRKAIVIGYGPVGQLVVRLLRENQIVPTVIDSAEGEVALALTDFLLERLGISEEERHEKRKGVRDSVGA